MYTRAHARPTMIIHYATRGTGSGFAQMCTKTAQQFVFGWRTVESHGPEPSGRSMCIVVLLSLVCIHIYIERGIQI